PDSGLGGHQMIAAKAASRRGSLVALLLVDEKSEWAVAVYEGPGFDRRRTFPVSPGRYLQFDDSDRILLLEQRSPLRSSLVSVDWRGESAHRLGAIPGLEVVGVLQDTASRFLL